MQKRNFTGLALSTFSSVVDHGGVEGFKSPQLARVDQQASLLASANPLAPSPLSLREATP